jgi:hypothetical protein
MIRVSSLLEGKVGLIRFKNGSSKKVDFFNIKSNQWKAKAAMPDPRYLHCALLY